MPCTYHERQMPGRPYGVEAYNGGGVSAISILNNKGDRTNPYGNGDADEVDETNVPVPDGFTQPIFNIQPLLMERKFHNDRVGMKLGGGREPKGEITTPLKEYLDRFRGT